MIKFVYAEQPFTQLLFRDVQNHQFFINNGGSLCQKTSPTRYIIIATETGEPCSRVVDIVQDTDTILKKLPEVKTIQFD